MLSIQNSRTTYIMLKEETHKKITQNIGIKT
jgi:hypothetical protein